jgi:hypothetical protein
MLKQKHKIKLISKEDAEAETQNKIDKKEDAEAETQKKIDKQRRC